MVLQSKSEKQTRFCWSACLSLFNKKFRKKIRNNNLIYEKTMDQEPNDLNISENMKSKKSFDHDNLVYLSQEPSSVSTIIPPLESNPSPFPPSSALSPPPYKKHVKHRVKSDVSVSINQENSSRSRLSVEARHPSLGGILSEEEREQQATSQCKTWDSPLLLHTLPPPSIPLPPPPFRYIPKQDKQLKNDSNNPYELIEIENMTRSVKTDKACYDAVVTHSMKKKHS